SIMGALTLRMAGRDDVRALENGTMGQLLAGGELEYGQTRTLGSSNDPRKALGVAQRLREAYALDIISLQAASSIPGTCYWLDVRSPEQYAKGHIPQSISAPGGQLVQQVDHWCPVLGATIVLIDTDGLSATTTGIWLKLMGWQVKVLLVADLALTATNDHHRETNLTAPTADMAVLDVGESRDYKKGHVPHSVWINRSDL